MHLRAVSLSLVVPQVCSMPMHTGNVRLIIKMGFFSCFFHILFIHPFFSLLTQLMVLGSWSYPSWHRVRGGGHPGPPSLSQPHLSDCIISFFLVAMIFFLASFFYHCQFVAYLSLSLRHTHCLALLPSPLYTPALCVYLCSNYSGSGSHVSCTGADSLFTYTETHAYTHSCVYVLQQPCICVIMWYVHRRQREGREWEKKDSEV